MILVRVLQLTSLLCIATGRHNVVFLVSDDMRPEIGAYLGDDFPSHVHPNIHTPNLDKLAARSLLLKRAYVQQAVCNPSRASLLTGRRPDTTHVHDMLSYFREDGGNFTTIPQYFKNYGYTTAGMGKIFHPGRANGYDDPISWTEPYFHGSNANWGEEYQTSWYMADDEKVRKYPLEDQQTTQHAIESLKKFAPAALSGEKPFFLALGIHRPHLPFVVPKSFFNYYPASEIQLPPNPHIPEGMPEIAWAGFGDLRAFKDIGDKYGYGVINTTFPDDVVKGLRRAYYSSITYTDSLIGDVIQAIDDLNLTSNTIVSFWGDHGWQLGEHAEWCKHTNFELATHAPMMVHVPRLTDMGVSTENLVEFVDLFPTLAEAAGLPKVPLCPEDSLHIETCTEGVSMMPLIQQPARSDWKSAAFTQYPRMGLGGGTFMGYTMRTNQYRYTEWVYFNVSIWRPQWNYSPSAVELYDHNVDPDENMNRASKPEYAQVKKQLAQKIRAGWRKALPQDYI